MRWSKRGSPFRPEGSIPQRQYPSACKGGSVRLHGESAGTPPFSEMQCARFSTFFSWLFAFGVVNASNQFVATIGRMLYQLTEPALRPIRRVLPAFGGLDLSPIVLLLIIFLIERIIIYYIYPYVF